MVVVRTLGVVICGTRGRGVVLALVGFGLGIAVVDGFLLITNSVKTRQDKTRLVSKWKKLTQGVFTGSLTFLRVEMNQFALNADWIGLVATLAWSSPPE